MMNFKKIITFFTIVAFMLTACKNEAKKPDVKTETTAIKTEKVNLNISGMTCEIGCAKTIQSKLSKKEGVASAKVIFRDSLAVIEYDATKTNKKELITFVNSVAGGKIYIATETDRVAKSCGFDCKKSCCADKNKKNCKKKVGCKGKKTCDKKNKATCKLGCTKPCCNNKNKKA